MKKKNKPKHGNAGLTWTKGPDGRRIYAPKGSQPSQPSQPTVQTEHTHTVITDSGNTFTVKMTTKQKDEWLNHLKAKRAELQKQMDEYDNDINILEGKQ